MVKFKVNPIEEYFKDRVSSDELKRSDLFSADDDDIDLKTDLSEKRIVLINTLHETDIFLKKRGLQPIFQSYYEKQLRLLISKDRQSRKEFVDVEKDKKEEIGEQFKNMMGAR